MTLGIRKECNYAECRVFPFVMLSVVAPAPSIACKYKSRVEVTYNDKHPSLL